MPPTFPWCIIFLCQSTIGKFEQKCLCKWHAKERIKDTKSAEIAKSHSTQQPQHCTTIAQADQEDIISFGYEKRETNWDPLADTSVRMTAATVPRAASTRARRKSSTRARTNSIPSATPRRRPKAATLPGRWIRPLAVTAWCRHPAACRQRTRRTSPRRRRSTASRRSACR